MSSITFTLVQTALHWEDKQANLQMLEEKIKGIKEETQVVILPEMFSTGFSMKPELLAETMEGSTVQWMKKVAADKKVILTGSVIISSSQAAQSSQTAEDGQAAQSRDGQAAQSRDGQAAQSGQTIGSQTAYYNRSIWMQPDGKYGYYNKRHLFAYAEEHKHYTAGTERLIASANGWKINLQVCYDLRFPVWARQSPSPSGRAGEGPEAFEYDVLIYVANWPEKRSLAWKTLLQARAIENQCYVIGVNRVGDDGNGIYHSGDSMVINPLGEILYHKEKEEDIFTITLDKNELQKIRERFQFWRDGDDFKISI